MAQAEIIIADESLLPDVLQLYNEVLRPRIDMAFLRRRFRGRYNVLVLMALVDKRPAGFKIGFELKPGMFYSWVAAVLPEYRRQGLARQLFEAQLAWCREHGYDFIRMEASHNNRVALHYCLEMGFNIVGIRWDSTYADQMVLFERPVSD